MRWKGKIIEFLATGNRPLRIFVFGGIFLAWLIMKVLAGLFDIETNLGGDIHLPNIVLIVVSLLTGFSAVYLVVSFLENERVKHTGEEEQEEENQNS